MITADIDTLSKRGLRVCQILNCLTLRDDGPAFERKSSSSSFAIVVHDGKNSRHYRSADRDTRFSVLGECLAMYIERWSRTSQDDSMYTLVNSSLNVYTVDTNNMSETEIFCIHSEPSLESDSCNPYKKSFHVHVSTATSPINKSHIALNLRKLNTVINSLDEFNDTFKRSIEMIKQEVLERYK